MNLSTRQRACFGLLGLAVVGLIVDQLIGYDAPRPASAHGSSAGDSASVSTAQATNAAIGRETSKQPPADFRSPATANAAGSRVNTVRMQLEALLIEDSVNTGHLPAAAVQLSLTDAFGMSDLMLARVNPAPILQADTPEAQLVLGPNRPALPTTLKLSSILFFKDAKPENGVGTVGTDTPGPARAADANDAVAVIDGRACRLGDAISGWVVREITPRTVLLEEAGDWSSDGGARTLRLELRDRNALGAS